MLNGQAYSVKWPMIFKRVKTGLNGIVDLRNLSLGGQIQKHSYSYQGTRQAVGKTIAKHMTESVNLNPEMSKCKRSCVYHMTY